MVFDSASFDGHEQVVFVNRAAVGLRAIIAIHATTLGAACGGCRMWSYASEMDALEDVLRLSRGMSYKSALAGVPLGGGKSVIIGDPRHQKSDALLEAFGEAVEELGGRYVVAEDVGICEADVRVMARRTRHATGVALHDEASRDPSPKTAWGVFRGLEAAVAHGLGRPSVAGLTVAVQGLGAVGWRLADALHDAGASLVVSDLNPARLDRARAEFGAEIVEPESIVSADVDVLAPCALGAVINEDTIPRIKARLIAGAANNQLATAEDGRRLAERGILFAPDYVINAGGSIAVAHDYLGTATEDQVWSQIETIFPRTLDIFTRADAAGLPSDQMADRMAREIIAAGPRRAVRSAA
ncbi:MAG: Leu/Phe/Val dehydrogenase [Geminicoccaceae bacterium]